MHVARRGDDVGHGLRSCLSVAHGERHRCAGASERARRLEADARRRTRDNRAPSREVDAIDHVGRRRLEPKRRRDAGRRALGRSAGHVTIVSTLRAAGNRAPRSSDMRHRLTRPPRYQVLSSSTRTAARLTKTNGPWRCTRPAAAKFPHRATHAIAWAELVGRSVSSRTSSSIESCAGWPSSMSRDPRYVVGAWLAGHRHQPAHLLRLLRHCAARLRAHARRPDPRPPRDDLRPAATTAAPLSMRHRPRRRGRVALKPSRRAAASPVPGPTRPLRPASRRSMSLSPRAARRLAAQVGQSFVYPGQSGSPRAHRP
jgi:hypothetical protein